MARTNLLNRIAALVFAMSSACALVGCAADEGNEDPVEDTEDALQTGQCVEGQVGVKMTWRKKGDILNVGTISFAADLSRVTSMTTRERYSYADNWVRLSVVRGNKTLQNLRTAPVSIDPTNKTTPLKVWPDGGTAIRVELPSGIARSPDLLGGLETGDKVHVEFQWDDHRKFVRGDNHYPPKCTFDITYKN